MEWTSCLEGDVATLACIPIVIKNVIQWALIFAGVVALFLIIFAGFKFVTSKGDPQEVDNAKKTLTYAIIGLLLILFSFALVNFFGGLFNVNLI